MMVLCILLAMLSLFLSLKLIYQRKLVQKVKKQIDFLIDRDTQTEIMVEKTDGTIQDLAASINHLLKKYRSMGQEIERSDTLFRDTITSLSHDLRTPLATANGYIQLLQEQDLTGEQKEYATIAGERISAVKLLLDQLFEFARIEADELKLNCRNTDIHSVLRDKQMVKVALVVSIIALAVCLLTALHGVLSDGLKGLKQRSKPIGISFLIYAVAFLLFIFFQ